MLTGKEKAVLLRESWEVGQDFFYVMERQMGHRFLPEVGGIFFFVSSVVAIGLSF